MRMRAISEAGARAYAAAVDAAAKVPIPGRPATRFQPNVRPNGCTRTMLAVHGAYVDLVDAVRRLGVDPAPYAADPMRARAWLGQEVVVPSGTHLIDEPIRLGPGAILRGEPGARLVARGLGNRPIVDATGAAGCRVQGLELDLASEPGAFPVGIHADGADGAILSDLVLINSGQVGPNDTVQGVLARYHRGLVVRDVRSVGCQLKLGGPGGNVEKLRVYRVHSTGAHNHSISLVITDPGGNWIRDVEISECLFESPHQSGLFIGDDGPAAPLHVENVWVRDCTFTPSETGDDGVNIHACDVTSAHFSGCRWEGAGDRAVHVAAWLPGQEAHVTVADSRCEWRQIVRMAAPGRVSVSRCSGPWQAALDPSSLGGASLVLSDCRPTPARRAPVWARIRHDVTGSVRVAGGAVERVQLDHQAGALRAILPSTTRAEVVSGTPDIVFQRGVGNGPEANPTDRGIGGDRHAVRVERRTRSR